MTQSIIPRLSAADHGPPIVNSTSMRVGLVGCCKAKRDCAAPARDFYLSRLYLLSRAWVMQHCDAWAILSARYGLVLPDTVIEPYNLSLHHACIEYRLCWAHRVNVALGERFPGAHFVVLAGAEYRRALLPDLRSLTVALAHDAPLAGMGIGQQLAWLKRALNSQEVRCG